MFATAIYQPRFKFRYRSDLQQLSYYPASMKNCICAGYYYV